jgi:hypothetical protein
VNRSAVGGAVLVAATVAALVFIGVAVNELNYASDHPYAYGPAKVIAWAAGAGALLSAAVGALGFALARADRR